MRAVYRHPLINEIIVVDDGSKDNTGDIVKKFEGIKLVVQENKGKSQAVAAGINQSKEDLLLFIDADLIGLTSQNISDLIEPVIRERADVSISLRKNAPWLYRKIGLDFISGERVFPKKLIKDNLEEIKKLANFGLESYLNKLVIKNNYRIKIVYWENVISPWKYKKNGLLAGLRGDFFMILDILKTISIFEIIYQIAKMLSLKRE